MAEFENTSRQLIYHVLQPIAAQQATQLARSMDSFSEEAEVGVPDG
jgi:hypothetical protein